MQSIHGLNLVTVLKLHINLHPVSESGIHAHIPRAAWLIIGISPRAVHIGTRRGIPGGLGITRTPLAFVEDVIHAAGQADVFGHVPRRAQAKDAIRADLGFL